MQETQLLIQKFEKIIPNKKEIKTMSQISDFILSLLKLHLKLDFIKDFCLTGSIAKNTFIKNHKQLDIFAICSTSISIEGAFNRLKEAADEKKLNYIINYADHHYLTLKIKIKSKEYCIDLVPCYRENKDLSKLDRTLRHVEYINKHMSFEQRRFIICFKQLLKSLKIYGAETTTSGFAGYACECLVLKYNTITQIIAFLQKKKFLEDPTYSGRNLLASVSEKSINILLDWWLYFKNELEYNSKMKIKAFEQIKIRCLINDFFKIRRIIRGLLKRINIKILIYYKQNILKICTLEKKTSVIKLIPMTFSEKPRKNLFFKKTYFLQKSLNDLFIEELKIFLRETSYNIKNNVNNIFEKNYIEIL